MFLPPLLAGAKHTLGQHEQLCPGELIVKWVHLSKSYKALCPEAPGGLRDESFRGNALRKNFFQRWPSMIAPLLPAACLSTWDMCHRSGWTTAWSTPGIALICARRDNYQELIPRTCRKRDRSNVGAWRSGWTIQPRAQDNPPDSQAQGNRPSHHWALMMP